MRHHNPDILLRIAIYRRLLGAQFRVALVLEFDLLLDALDPTGSSPFVHVDAGENEEDEVQHTVVSRSVSFHPLKPFDCD